MVKYFLYGPSGSGKSTAGRQLARDLDLPFIDLDTSIAAAAGASIPEIFERDGELAFRALERRTLDQALSTPGETIIALGGGALLDPENRAKAESAGPVLCLHADPGALLDRLQAAGDPRPLLTGRPEDHLEAYLAGRAPHYRSFPNHLDTTRLNPGQTAARAATAFGAFRITGMGPPYDARIRRGALADLPAMLDARSLSGPYLLVADSNTTIYAEAIAAGLTGASILILPAGEASKTAQTTGRVWAALSEAGLERGSTLIAVGGGMIGDLGGFAAATYLRGIDWVGVPTSLLAMVDASLGGKTGVDLPAGKNLVGAFHAPRLVLADPDTLSTLPPKELANGMAETIKAAVIGDPALFRICAAPPLEQIDEAVRRAAGVKVRTIIADPYESGVRMHLNFGHTIGHAIEHVSGYQLSHGEAVAIGMVAETRLAEILGLADAGLAAEIAACLESHHLPTEIPAGLNGDAVLQTMLRDKKKKFGKMRFALPVRIGEMVVQEIAEAEYRTVVTE